MRYFSALTAAICLVVIGLAACASLAGTEAQPTLPISSLTIETERGLESFTVELADEVSEIQRGMMFRQSIGENEGMLFDIGRRRVAFFWMRNTLIPLDIIFIDAQGRILNIVADAVPNSEERIYFDSSARGVLEIGGGRAQQLGIVSGNLVRHSIFGNESLEN